MLAAIYLDPRYQILLNQDQKLQAKNHILVVYNCIQNINNSTSEHIEPENFVVDDESEDELMNIIKEKQANLPILKKSSNQSLSINNIIHSYDQIPVSDYRNKNFNIFEYWSSVPQNFNELKETAFVIFTAAATQVSVERAFSVLRYVLSERRGNLDKDLLEAILFILLNERFFQNKT